MRAALYRGMGKAAEVFRVEEVDRPEPEPGEVLVRVRASGVNPADYRARSVAVPRPIDDFQIPHHDGADHPELPVRARMSGGEAGVSANGRPAKGAACEGRAGGVARRRPCPPQQGLLLREDPRVVGSAPDDPRAHPVASAAAVAPPAAAV